MNAESAISVTSEVTSAPFDTGRHDAASGYRHPRYAASLTEYGTPRLLGASDGWIFERAIGEGSGERDARGGYPLFACGDWSGLPEDLAGIDDLVSLTVVSDPFGDYDAGLLTRAFPDLVRPFKQHFVADLTRPIGGIASAHHRRNARRARASLVVEVLDDPWRHADEWTCLYATLVRRHDIRGAAAFSPGSLAAQLRVPGLVALRARESATTVGMTLWFVQGDVAYYHLAAYTDRGYVLGASFALFDAAFRWLRGRAAWAALGGPAGASATGDDGLSRFKAGWSTGTRTAWLCGRIFAPERHAALTAAAGGRDRAYFPAYRWREVA